MKCARCKGDGTLFAGPNGHATHLINCPDCGGTGIEDAAPYRELTDAEEAAEQATWD